MFADGFEDRMQALMDQYRNLQPVCIIATNENINEQIRAGMARWEWD